MKKKLAAMILTLALAAGVNGTGTGICRWNYG